MNERQEKLVVVIEESAVGSVIKDVFTFGMFGGLLWFNHQYLAGHILVDMLFIIIVMLFLSARASNSVFKGKPKDAIKYLTDKEK